MWHRNATWMCATIMSVTDNLAKLRAIMRRYRQFDVVRAQRDAEIAELVKRGVPREQICRITGLTREQVRRITNAEQARRATAHDAAAEVGDSQDHTRP
jgi:DNA invertase Pin-like site-specific DNA recombinase